MDGGWKGLQEELRNDLGIVDRPLDPCLAWERLEPDLRISPQLKTLNPAPRAHWIISERILDP
jgi:hypothetical protein